MFYPKNFEQKIGFDKIRNILKSKCLSPLGKNQVDDMAFTTDFEYIRLSLLLTDEFKQICIYEADFPVSFYFDVRPFLNKIRLEGTYLTVEELFDLKRSIEAIKEIVHFFKNAREEKYPNLRLLAKDVIIYPYVVDKINNILNKNGQVRDNASNELLVIRKDLFQKQNSVSAIMHKLLRQAQAEGWAESDATLSVRDGKMLIPVASTNKRKIKGIVQDESATGKTSFIEPYESIELNNEIRELEFAERREIIKILIDFANQVRPYIDELLKAYEFLGIIDFIRAKALLAIDLNAVKPFLANENKLDFRAAKHPLLYLSHKKENKPVVPLDIEMNQTNRIILISGPNAGGKSVCLKTVGLVQYMIQCGLLIPVNETSIAGIYNQIFIDIGDEQSIENDLSTYSSHLLNMKFFIENADDKTLVLIDEFGAGTEPMHGGAISESILDSLNKTKVHGVITTHYTNLKHFASSAEGIINGAMLFDRTMMRPLFQLAIGKPGSSFAFEIAKNIGLPEYIIQNSMQKVGQNHIDFEKNLREIEEERTSLQVLKHNLLQKEKEAETLIQKYNTELDITLKQKKEIIKSTLNQSQEIIAGINKKIENTIFEIRKENAEKEKTAELRKQLEEYKQEIIDHQKKVEERIEAKIRKIKEMENRRKQKTENKTENITENLQNNKRQEKQISINKHQLTDDIIRIGDFVKIKDQNTVVEVIEIRGNSMLVASDNIQLEIHKDKLQKANENDLKRLEREKRRNSVNIVWDGLKSKGDFMFGLDLRGKHVEEAIPRLERYLDEAALAEAHEIKILHGTGNGILKQQIRKYLKTIPFVKSFKDELIELGGAGITVVELDYM